MNNRNSSKRNKRTLRHARVRSVVSGSPERPRLSVFRSGSHIYAQLIDDSKGQTLAAASTRDVKKKAVKTSMSGEVGKMIAEKAKTKGITKVVFDRGGFRYQGR